MGENITAMPSGCQWLQRLPIFNLGETDEVNEKSNLKMQL